ncbi:hypothetical protein [Candidatus Sororendozoicomonas aggregata]|uniref:LPS-assembly lipoprotein LptE n=1 Tax=Candidatus Sororendozoicomonas aggregata TaxID=3073239 RepID=UPI002ED50128
MTYCLRQGVVLTLLFTISLLSACGFHLRGRVDINSELKTLSISGSHQHYTRELTRALQVGGITVSDSAPYTVNVIKVDEQTGDQNLLSAGRSEQQLTLKVTYQLETRDKLPLFNPVTLETMRFISLGQNQSNAAQSEKQLTFEELRQILIIQNVQRIANISKRELKAEEDRVREAQAQKQAADQSSTGQ